MARIAFVQNFWFEQIGSMSLSAFLKRRGHSVEVFVDDDAALLERVRQGAFDLVGFGIMTCHEKWMLRLAARVKEAAPGVPVVVGGPHPTFFPEVIEKPPVDIACVGEGEEALVELADAVDAKADITKIRNLLVKKDGVIHRNPVRELIADLDGMPFPDRTLYHKYAYFREPEITVMIASRGCPYRCAFCFNHTWNELYKGKGRVIRLRSPEHIFGEVEYIRSLGIRPKILYFVDSTFNLNKEWCLDFFRKYRGKSDIPFTCNYTAGLLDEAMVKAIADTGLCKTIRFAVEVGNERLRREVLGKNITNEQLMNAASLLKRYKIPMFVYNMFGAPTETLEEAQETIRFNQAIAPETVSNLIFMPYPGLSITEFALAKGIITQEDLARLTRPPFTRLRSVLRQKDIAQVSNIHKFSLLYIRLPRLSPLFDLLVRLPENKLFDLVYMVTTAWETITFLKMGMFSALKEMFRHRKEMDMDAE